MHFHGCTYIKILGRSEKIRLEGAGEVEVTKRGKIMVLYHSCFC